jgi:endo-1,4-beta-D-glucanase Y
MNDMTSQARRTGTPLHGLRIIRFPFLLVAMVTMVGCGNSPAGSGPEIATGTNTGGAPSSSTGTNAGGQSGATTVGGAGGAVTSSFAGGATNASSAGGTTGSVNNTTAGGTAGSGNNATAGGNTGVGGTKGSSNSTPVGGTTSSGTKTTTGGTTSSSTNSAVGGTSSTGSSSTSVTQVPWINANAKNGTNTLGIQGDWYAFSDGVTSTQTGNPHSNGKYCIKGTAPGDGDSTNHWGAGLGLDLNSVNGTKSAYNYDGKITGFRIKLEGTVPSTPRVQFVNNLDGGVQPFISATMGSSVVYSIADAIVPLDWDVPNAGKAVEGGVLYSLQILVDGAQTAGAIDFCISEFEPIYDTTTPVTTDTPYVNKDGFILQADNSFGIQGPVYAISDGNSSTQSGNPYSSGKYCITGTFSGSSSDWGAGIAFDLNKAPGGSSIRNSYAYKDKVAGFRIKLSGTTPGRARIQFIVNEPQDGDQPFLAALVNTTTVYRIAWAQVPTSWNVTNAGQEVGTSLYTLQLYLEGDHAGPFNVCIDELTPLASADLSTNAQAAATGFTGARTVSDAMLQQEYDFWKANRLKECGDNSTACVPRDDGNCISEGIGYGMLITAGYDDQATFKKLWAYFNKHKNSKGMMNWRTDACGNDIETGAATDGDLDAAMALIQAGCKWGGTYKSEAVTLIKAIRNNAVTTCNNQMVLKPGDTFGGCDRTNPSYIAPGYYKVFATAANDTSWNTMATDGYALLSTLQGKMNGLVPNWTDSSGTIPGGTDGEYGPDAPRTPWRVATDYVWNGEAKAVTFLDKVATHIDSNKGVQRLFDPNSAYRGGLGLSGLQKTSAKAQEYTDAWLTTSVDDGSYFPGTLRPIYLLLAAHKFAKGCN